MHCVTKQMNVGFLWIEQKKIDVDPPYQRESGVWSTDKKQLFIDSLINNFDVPKIYLHDKTSDDTPYSYAVIDGKQRLDAIWNFMSGRFGLASDFRFIDDDGDEDAFKAGASYADLTDRQKEVFKSKSLDVVLVRHADTDDIEELFSRLNNGEPLNAAEKRNALGGDMIGLIRDFAKHSFFDKRLGFPNRRLSHHEVAAKLVRLEMNDKDGSGDFCDLKKKFLDELVVKHKMMSESDKQGLTARLNKRLRDMDKLFSDNDPLLGKQSYPQLYYGWVKQVTASYSADNLFALMHDFLEKFQRMRIENLQRPEDDRSPMLVEYGRLMQQGTNDLTSMEARARLLTRHLLLEHPELTLKDTARSFTEDERFVIWVRSGKQCAVCQISVSHEEMEADHVQAWAKGGATNLANAQGLCVTCNRKKGSRPAEGAI